MAPRQAPARYSDTALRAARAQSSAATSLGSTGSGPMVEIAHTHVVPCARGNNRKSGMKLEAPACQSIERAAAAPVEGQEAARLAGNRTGDGVTLYDDRPRAA